MNLFDEIQDLVEVGVITQETADKIELYYKNKKDLSINKFFVLFGLIGSILIILGIVLILAHNWETFSSKIKVILAFIPLLLAQFFCGFVLLKKQNNIIVKESSSVFLFFSIGISLVLVRNILNISDTSNDFIFTWMLLVLPMIYIMRSSVVSLFYIVWITYYAVDICYWSFPSILPLKYWFLLLGVLPYYYSLNKSAPKSLSLIFHNWFIPFSIIVSLGTVSNDYVELMYIAYFSLFGLYSLIGNSSFLNLKYSKNNGYKILGLLGTFFLLITLSFDWFWDSLILKKILLNELVFASEFYVSIIIFLIALVIFYLQHKSKLVFNINPLEIVFILFVPIFIFGLFSSFAALIMGVLVFLIGLFFVKDGVKNINFGKFNFGLLMILIFFICRFFDQNFSFFIKGILFVILGIMVFVSNYCLLKKKFK